MRFLEWFMFMFFQKINISRNARWRYKPRAWQSISFICHYRLPTIFRDFWEIGWGRGIRMASCRLGSSMHFYVPTLKRWLYFLQQRGSTAIFNHVGDGVVVTYHQEYIFQVIDYPSLVIRKSMAFDPHEETSVQNFPSQSTERIGKYSLFIFPPLCWVDTSLVVDLWLSFTSACYCPLQIRPRRLRPTLRHVSSKRFAL